MNLIKRIFINIYFYIIVLGFIVYREFVPWLNNRYTFTILLILMGLFVIVFKVSPGLKRSKNDKYIYSGIFFLIMGIITYFIF